MEIIQVNNPFQRQNCKVKQVKHTNFTVETLLINHLKEVEQDSGLSMSLETAKGVLRISLNGLVIPPEFWDTTKPTKNDQLVIMPIVAGGDDGKQILNIVILIAVVFFFGPEAGMTWWEFAVASAIVVGTGVLLQALTPTPSAKGLNFDDYENSQVFSWQPHTTQKQGIVKPVFFGENKLYGNVVAVHTEVNDSDDTKQILKMIVGLGSGPVQGIVDGSLKINGQLATNYSDVITEEKLGTLNQSAVSFFTKTKVEFKASRLVTNDGGGGNFTVFTTPDSDYDDLEIDVVFNRGVYFADNSGGLSNHSVGIKIDISEAGADSWSTLVVETITDNVTSPKTITYTASETYTGGSPVIITNGIRYDVRLHKTTVDQTSTRYGDRLTIGSVREIMDDSFTYPKLSLLGVSALATDQLSGRLEISCIQQGVIVNVWDGASWSLEYSNNPAWVLFHILSQPVISGDNSSGLPYTIERYDSINPSKLDLTMFFVLAQFCDDLVPDGSGGTEKRITFNGGFDIGTTPWEAALKVSEVARCMPIWTGSELTLAIDKAGEPVQSFNVSNQREDSFRESFMPQNELISEIEIHYRDKQQDYTRTPFTILEDSIPNASRKMSLEMFGITSQSEAWRAGMHRLSQNRYLKSTIEFGANIDAINSTLGNIIWVQHDVPQWGAGGRVKSGTSLSIITDKDMVYTEGEIHEVLIRQNNDDALNIRTTTSQYNSIVGVNSTNKEFQIDGDFTDEYKSGDRVQVADSGSNDQVYTLSSDAVFDSSGVTLLYTVEDIVDDTVIDSGTLTDGGIYNLRRIVVSSVFKDKDNVTTAPTVNALYTFGIQGLHSRKYRIINMKKDSDQYATISAIEYNPLVYAFDGDTPVITPQQGISNPGGDLTPILTPPGQGGVDNTTPPFIRGGPIVDVPLTTNLAWINGDSGSPTSIAWAEADNENPILFTISGVTYEITEALTTKTYVYWDESSPTAFQASDLIADATSDGKWLMAVNEGGIAFPAFGRKIIHGGHIQAGTLSVDYAEITNVDIQTADIGDLQVETLKIGNNAVSDSVSAYTAGSISIPDFSGEVTIQSVVLTTIGSSVLILANSLNFSIGSGAIYRIKRDSTVLFSFTGSGGRTAMVTDQPSSGTYTYSITINSSTFGSATHRFLYAQELRK